MQICLTLVCISTANGLVAPSVRMSASAATPKRVLFLFSDTGGGHRASALALRDALEASYPGRIECDLVDLFVEAGRLPFCEYPTIYKQVPGSHSPHRHLTAASTSPHLLTFDPPQLAENPWSWKAVFDFGDSLFGIWFNELFTTFVCYDDFRRLLKKPPKPDLVVSVHPLLQATPLKALASLDGGTRTTPFVTVVTDLGSASAQWFDKRVDKCYVPSAALRSLAQRRELRDEQIAQYGLPIRRGFWQGGSDGVGGGDKDETRKALGLKTSMPTVLVVGGGDGMGGLSATASAIGEGLGSNAGESQLVVVCGRNEAAVAELGAQAWPSNVRAEILGFVNNMDQVRSNSRVWGLFGGPPV